MTFKTVAFVVVSDELGHLKPDPKIFKEALRKLGDPSPDSTLLVGDNPDADIGGAQGMGMMTAWVRRERSFPEGKQRPDYEIDRVDELRPVLGELTSES